MSRNYVVTAQKPTSVAQSVTGHFTSPTDINLIISKSTRLEIHTLTPEGLQPFLDVGVYGRIATIQLFRPANEPQDWLFLSTERYEFCVLAFDPTSQAIVTKARGDLQDQIGRAADCGHICIVDPETRLVGLHLYDGLFKVIPIVPTTGVLEEAFNIRLEELQVIDIQFLFGTELPTIAVLYQDAREARHVKTYEIKIREKQFADGALKQANVEPASSLLIPIPQPFGGVLVVAEETITYLSTETTKTISMRKTIMKSFGRVDPNGSRHLLCDYCGGLYVVLLETNETGRVLDIRLEMLGTTSIASSISYLDNGVVFCGSAFGDSQLIRLKPEKDEESGSYIEVLDTYTNLGPIVDFCVVDTDGQGQGQIVTCSGAFKDGSIRVIRNGIGIDEQATIELPNVRGLWTIRSPTDKQHDKYIVISFVKETRVLLLEQGELEETTIGGFDSETKTLYCGNTTNDQLVQVTENSIRLVDGNSLELVTEWKPPGEQQQINVCGCNTNQIVVSAGRGSLFYLEIEKGQLNLIKQTELEHEISCLSINTTPDTEKDGKATLCCVGLWTDISVRVLAIPTLEQVTKESMGGDCLIRSVLLASFEGTDYVLCALGDGHLITFRVDATNGALSDRKKISLGTQPILLNLFAAKSATHVFAASDRPTVIYGSNRKLLYSNVNLKQVNYMCPLHSPGYPDSLIISNDSSITIGTIDDIQKLHIRTIPLGEMPRRIAHQESTHTFCLLSVSTTTTNDERAHHTETEKHWVKLLDDQTFETIASFPLERNEDGTSVCSLKFEGDDTEYYMVGMCHILRTEPEPTRGRLLVFRVDNGKLDLVYDKDTKGAPYSISPFCGKVIVGINSCVHLFSWKKQQGEGVYELVEEAQHVEQILSLYTVTRGEFIVVGDLMRSISLLRYNPIEGSIEEIARDYNPTWMTSVEALDDETFLGAESSYNLFTVQKNVDATTDEERGRLTPAGEWHAGEFINRFRHGSLVMNQPDTDKVFSASVLFSTVNGTIGVVGTLNQTDFDFLFAVQKKMSQVIGGVGGFSHDVWRSFSNERRTVPASGFIDGDLIESFLDLSREKMEEVVRGLDTTVEELCKRIESISQALH